MRMPDAANVFDVKAQTFQTDVVDRSRQVPVVLLFWTTQIPAAASMFRTLEALAGQYGGKFVLGSVDVARDQMVAQQLAQQLRVQALPSVRVIHEGQIVEQLDGPQGEALLRKMLDRLTMSSGDLLREDLKELIAAKNYRGALGVLQQALKAEPNNPAFKVEQADLLALTGQVDQARAVLATLPETAEGRDRPATRVQLIDEAKSLPASSALGTALAEDPDNLELVYQAALRAAADGDLEAALEHAMAILRRDRKFREDVGRTLMIRIFTLLGKGSEVAARYRRQMFNFMH
jgi:putative thioredoxin